MQPILGKDIQEHNVFNFYINHTLTKINFDISTHGIGEKMGQFTDIFQLFCLDENRCFIIKIKTWS